MRVCRDLRRPWRNTLGQLPTRIAAEERVPAPVKVEPSGLSAGLRLGADEFVPTHTGATEESAEERRGAGGGRTSSIVVEAAGTCTIRPTPYDGRTAWDAYKTQFAMLFDMNRRSDAEKATYLAINLKGSALTVLSNLPEHRRRDYGALTAALDARFGVAHQTELNRVQLRNRRRRRDEGLPELAEDVERLTRLAYPGADSAMLKVLAKDKFVDAVPREDMRLRLRQMRPSSLREALQLGAGIVHAGGPTVKPIGERDSFPGQHAGFYRSNTWCS